MFGLGFGEIILLVMIALVVIGPKQLPQVARILGRFIGEFKRTVGDFSDEIHRASRAASQENQSHKQQIRESLDKITKIPPTAPPATPASTLPPIVDEKNDV
jgi:sec-independent protein translocase protein TatB